MSVRDSFFHQIFGMVREGADIVVVTSDLGAPSLDEFRRLFPERYISVGIAEQSLITVSAGLALAGRSVVAYGLNPFPVTRAYDPIRCLMAERKIPVTLCALNAGLCSAESGYTHMAIEDVGMVRMLSNLQVTTPSDEGMAEELAMGTATATCARYIRFDKTISGRIYGSGSIDFQTGFCMYGGGQAARLCIVTNGCFVQQLRILVDDYERRQIPIRLIDLHTLPADEEKLVKELGSVQCILTIEEHVLACGIGSLVLEILSDHQLRIPVRRFGMDVRDGYYQVFTDRNYIRKAQKLDEGSIRSAVEDCLQEGGAYEAQHRGTETKDIRV